MAQVILGNLLAASLLRSKNKIVGINSHSTGVSEVTSLYIHDKSTSKKHVKKYNKVWSQNLFKVHYTEIRDENMITNC